MIHLTKETAVVGMLCILIKDFDYKNVDVIEFTAMDVILFSNWLTFADCGPVVKMFSYHDVVNLLNSKTQITYDGRYRIDKLDRNELIKLFEPDLNYPASFLKFAKILDEDNL